MLDERYSLETIADYDVVESMAVFDLVSKVRKKMEKGWIPVGAMTPGGTGFNQTMILKRHEYRIQPFADRASLLRDD